MIEPTFINHPFTLYMPEHLGGKPLDVPAESSMYAKIVLGLLLHNNGTISDKGFTRLLPHTIPEAQQAEEVITLLRDTVVVPITETDKKESTATYNQEKLNRLVRKVLSIQGLDEQDSLVTRLFEGSYDHINPFATYDSRPGHTREVLDIPVELRQFVFKAMRMGGAITKINQSPTSLLHNRFEDVDSIIAEFPSLRIPLGALNKSELRVLSWVEGPTEDLPTHLNLKNANLVIDTIGAGTLLRALEKYKNFRDGDDDADLSMRELNYISIRSTILIRWK